MTKEKKLHKLVIVDKKKGKKKKTTQPIRAVLLIPKLEKKQQMTCVTHQLCPYCLHKHMLLIHSWPGSVLLKRWITYCPGVKSEQVDAQEEGETWFL